ncbi:hypothetical protein N7449_005093 [Penicillium cf. viridicatum]|uniref:Uncharacterized protein n=1 Tax=Penicillium cf. viridicatum TaxID=2972119 RepID=A0A9W9SYQ2_9EURO|nr:hypothetical protein N7449_005093 [Penicillium cf. viridicatum]
MVRRSLLLRVLLNTRILVPSTTKRCLHRLEGLFVADVPAETLGVADVPAETLGVADVPAETLGVADVPAETLGFADVPARRFVDAGPGLRRTW